MHLCIRISFTSPVFLLLFKKRCRKDRSKTLLYIKHPFFGKMINRRKRCSCFCINGKVLIFVKICPKKFHPTRTARSLNLIAHIFAVQIFRWANFLLPAKYLSLMLDEKLNPLLPNVPFWSPWKHQKTFGKGFLPQKLYEVWILKFTCKNYIWKKFLFRRVTKIKQQRLLIYFHGWKQAEIYPVVLAKETANKYIHFDFIKQF